MTEHIRLLREGQVATLLIDRPEKRNAFTSSMWTALRARIDEVAGDDTIRALVLRGAGPVFGAGGDIAEMREVLGDPSLAVSRLDRAVEAFDALAALPMPTIALIRGAAIGAGCELAISCDFRFADKTARFGLPPVRMGLVYGVAATRRVVDTVGLPAARMLLMTGNVIEAPEALEIGLVDRLCPPDDLERTVAQFTELLVSRSPFAMASIKAMLDRVARGQRTDDDESVALRHASYSGRDFAEAVTAFLEGRPAVFGEVTEGA